jgi:hypothetical protein
LTFTKLEPSAGGPSVLTYTINTGLHGVVTGSIYQFKVVATNDKGESLPSQALKNVMAAKLATAPTDLTPI